MTYLFVHGAWHAAWCWGRIVDQLHARGRSCLAPDLPGHGSNIRAANTVSFDDYVTSLIDYIQQQQEPVTLIGHSMAGLIISQVAEIIPDHIRELVFIAAYIPQDQQSLVSIAESAESREAAPFLIFDQAKQEIRLKSSPELKNVFFNRCTEADAQYAMSKLQAQPLKPFIEKVKLGDNFKRVPKRSFVCRYDRALILSDQVRMSQLVTDKIVYLEADHSAYFSAVEGIVEALS